MPFYVINSSLSILYKNSKNYAGHVLPATFLDISQIFSFLPITIKSYESILLFVYYESDSSSYYSIDSSYWLLLLFLFYIVLPNKLLIRLVFDNKFNNKSSVYDTYAYYYYYFYNYWKVLLFYSPIKNEFNELF